MQMLVLTLFPLQLEDFTPFGRKATGEGRHFDPLGHGFSDGLHAYAIVCSGLKMLIDIVA